MHWSRTGLTRSAGSEFARFVAAVGIATAIQFAIMVVMVQAADVSAVLASAAGYVSAALINYQLNRTFTFSSSVPHRSALSRFAVVSSAGLLINSASMYILVQTFSLNYLGSQVFTSLLVLGWNYALSRVWTFSAERRGRDHRFSARDDLP